MDDMDTENTTTTETTATTTATEKPKSRAPRPRKRSTYVPGKAPKRNPTKFEQRLARTMKALSMVLPQDPRQPKDENDPTYGRNLDISFCVGTPKDHFGFWVGIHNVEMIRGMTAPPCRSLVVFSLNDFGVVGPFRPDYEYAGPRRFLSEVKDALELAMACLVENRNVEQDDIEIRCNASFAEPSAQQLFGMLAKMDLNERPRTKADDLADETTKAVNEAAKPDAGSQQPPVRRRRSVERPGSRAEPGKAEPSEEPTALAFTKTEAAMSDERPIRRSMDAKGVQSALPPLRSRHRVAADPAEERRVETVAAHSARRSRMAALTGARK